MKLKKGSAAAKAYMAKLRAKRKKISGTKASTKIKKVAKKLKVTLPHGYDTKKGKVRLSGSHKDTKSHNVNKRVISGLNPPVKTDVIKLSQSNLNDAYHQLQAWENLLLAYKSDLKNEKDLKWKRFYKNEIKVITQVIRTLKKHITTIKKA